MTYILYRIQDFFYHLKMFFINLWTFKKELWYYNTYEFESIYPILKRHLLELEDTITFSYHSSQEKLKEIQRAIYLLDQLMDDEYSKKFGFIHGDYKTTFLPNGCYRLDSGLSEEQNRMNAIAIKEGLKQQTKDKNELWDLIKKKSDGWWD